MDVTRSVDAGTDLVLEFDGWARRVPLEARPLVLGRSSECDVPLADPKLSRRHCRLEPGQNGFWRIEDLGSQGGTFVDGVPVQAPTSLGPAQTLRFGSIEARLEQRGKVVPVADPIRGARNVGLLLRTVEDLYGTKDLQDLLRTIVDRAIELAGADRGALLLSGSGGALEAGVARDAAAQDLPPEQALTRSLPDRALASGRAVVVTDAEAPEQRAQASESVLLKKIRSILCVPLPGPQGPLGVLYVDGQRPAEDFGPAELSIFEALAVHSAVAIERARLRHERENRDQEARRRLQAENESLKAQLGVEVPIGDSAPMRQALELIRRVASSDATVCLTGETGTGKEVLARYLHRLSPRASGPFVVVDCGAIPEGLIESELFGHERGAFTGATAAREGRFREATRGTVFLDEIAELPLAMQTRLLRVLQERTVQPVGGTGRVPIDIRIVCATHRDLSERVAQGLFRQDLFYRISVLTVPVPALRERSGDVLLLAHHFLKRFGSAFGTAVNGFTREAAEAMLAYEWPGNVRELENRVQRAAILARSLYVDRGDIGLGESAEPAEAASGDRPFPKMQDARAEANDRFERAYIEEALRRTAGNVSHAANLADISRQMVQRLLRKHSIDRSLFSE